jgi:hypothetical protein
MMWVFSDSSVGQKNGLDAELLHKTLSPPPFLLIAGLSQMHNSGLTSLALCLITTLSPASTAPSPSTHSDHEWMQVDGTIWLHLLLALSFLTWHLHQGPLPLPHHPPMKERQFSLWSLSLIFDFESFSWLWVLWVYKETHLYIPGIEVSFSALTQNLAFFPQNLMAHLFTQNGNYQ